MDSFTERTVTLIGSLELRQTYLLTVTHAVSRLNANAALRDSNRLSGFSMRKRGVTSGSVEFLCVLRLGGSTVSINGNCASLGKYAL